MPGLKGSWPVLGFGLLAAVTGLCQDGGSPAPSLDVKGSVLVRIAPSGGRAFLLAKHEVTWGQYDAFCAATGVELRTRKLSGYTADASRIEFVPSDNHPVTKLSLADARAYCKWAGCRLPTETEWRQAAGPGRFPWGDSSPQGKVNGRAADAALPRLDYLARTGIKLPDWPDGYSFTAPVNREQKGITASGVADMAGNVWEWVEAPTAFVAMGGGWTTSPDDCTTTQRQQFESDQSGVVDFGFRVALDVRD